MVVSLAAVRFHASWRGGINIHISRGTTLQKRKTKEEERGNGSRRSTGPIWHNGARSRAQADAQRSRHRRRRRRELAYLHNVGAPARSTQRKKKTKNQNTTTTRSVRNVPSNSQQLDVMTGRSGRHLLLLEPTPRGAQGWLGPPFLSPTSSPPPPPHGCSSFPQSPKKERKRGEEERGE